MSVRPHSRRYLALVPARGGSKRLPGKNLMEIGGQSLIARALRCASEIGEPVTPCLSTDDAELAEEGRKYGPFVPFIRPAELATDSAKSFDVVKHAIDWFSERGETFDGLIFLQPTSPLRSSEHVKAALARFETLDADGVVSVCPAEHPPEWTARLSETGSMEAFGANLRAQKRSQDFEKAFRLNGAIYIYRIDRLIEQQGFFYSDHTYAYEMDQPSSVDIDTYDDYLLARFWAERAGAIE